jgi:hypothetical protein
MLLLMFPASPQAAHGHLDVPFSCDCRLGSSATPYHVRVIQEQQHARVNFSKVEQPSDQEKIEVQGTLVEFQLIGTDLVLIFDYPGPHTLVFSDDRGQIRRELDCSSNSTALFTWSRAVCFSGKRIDHDGVVSPERAIIYDRLQHPYKPLSDVPFEMLYPELAKVSASSVDLRP